jgi:hypothetical protein
VGQTFKLLGPSLRGTIALAWAFALASCTIVQVDGPAKVTRIYPGVLRIEPAADNSMIAYRSRGFGIVPGHNGVTVGFAGETAVAMADTDQCRVILFDPDPATIGELAALLQPVISKQQVCNLGG